MKKYFVEFIGTFALVFCGTGSIIVDQQTNGSLGLIGISASFGIIISAMVYTFGSISGAHINPAVTISLAIGNYMQKKDIIGYLFSQLLGAIVASIILSQLFPLNQSLGVTIPSGSILQSFSIEFILTFFLMLIILKVSTQKELLPMSGIIIGITVTGIILFAGPISGGSFNPARSLSPAIISGNLTSLWIYITAPILGASLATIYWKKIVV